MNIFATIFLAATAVTNASAVRTTAALYALSDTATIRHVKFDFTGTVTFVMSEKKFLFDDGTGHARIRTRQEPAVSPGDIVRVTGTSKTDRYMNTTLLGESVSCLGKTAPPMPIDATTEQIMCGECDWRFISIRGIVRDAFKDEIDPNWNYLVLNSDSHIIYAAFFDNGISDDKLTMLIDAEVSVSGACMPSNAGKRIFLGRHIHALSCSSVKVLVPAPADPFTAPILTYMRNAQPESVLHMKRRRAIGSVVAAWGSNQFLLETEKRQILRVELAHGKRLPAYGDGVEVVGVPDTDLYHINLSRAIYRPAKVSIRKRRTHSVTPADILKAPNGQTRIKAEFYGWTICMKGIIRHIPSPESGSGRMNIECGDFLVPIEASGCPECMNGLSVGMEIEVTGACLFDTENWRQTVFPRIKEFLIVVRKPDDVKILTRPPWWTMGRLLALVGTLLVIMSGIIIWNRALNRIVERRSRALLKERAAHDNANLKKEERTRLAVELHDTLAQNLTGVSLQIDAAQMAAEANPDSVLPYLESARRKMQNCRENLRNCLWDLRSRAFEERSLDEAIRKTIAPHVENADIQIDLPVPCRRLSDNAIHAVLCIVRELILNAIRHGKASSIKISGKLEKSGLSFTVADNGTGFDPATRLSIPEGHFGLQGILERTHRLGGTFEITSALGQGAVATFTNLSPNK